MMAGTILYCKKCGVGYASVGEVPPVCPACDQKTSWSTAPLADRPSMPYRITVNDRKFLRTIRIAVDDADDHIGSTKE